VTEYLEVPRKKNITLSQKPLYQKTPNLTNTKLISKRTQKQNLAKTRRRRRAITTRHFIENNAMEHKRLL